MNNKITFPKLATMLADKSGRSKRFSETFLREFFTLLTEQLEAGESVKVKGLGTFRLSRVEPRKSVDVTTGQPMEISGHSKVVFIPAKELAEAVNSPFEAFTAIEISDDTDLSLIFSEEEATEMLPESEHTTTDENIEIEPIAVPEPVVEQLHVVEPEPEPVIEQLHVVEPEPEPVIEQMHIVEPEPEPVIKQMHVVEPESEAEHEAVEEPKPVVERKPKKKISVHNDTGFIQHNEQPRTNLIRWMLIGLGAAMFALIATFVVWYFYATSDFNDMFRHAEAPKEDEEYGFVVGNHQEESITPEAVAVDTSSSGSEISDEEQEPEEVAPTAPSDAVVLDTISTTRYLTTMAKAHYGNYNLWPIIYQENQSFLGHPDRIRPGTPVVIPKLSKYGIDPNNKADIEKAKKLGVEIYARYGKSI